MDSSEKEKTSDKPEIRFTGFAGQWQQCRLGEIAEFNPKAPLPEKFEYVDLESVVGNDLTAHRTEWRESAPSRARRLAFPGDVLFQTVRPYQRNNCLFDIPFGDYVFSTGYTQMRPIGDSRFLLSLLSEDSFVKEVLGRCTGSSYPAINPGDLAGIFVRIPHEISEQAQIGELFEKLDRLTLTRLRERDRIANFRKTMLEKMFPKGKDSTPEIRLEGFLGPWQMDRLGQLGMLYSGLSGKQGSDFGHGEGEFVTFMNVLSNPIAHGAGTERIAIDTRQTEVQYGDVFFTASSEMPHEVAMSSVWLENRKNVYLNSFCFGWRPLIDMDPHYLSVMLRSPSVRKKLTPLAQGVSRYNVSRGRVLDVAVPIPSKAEQRRVGGFFATIDRLVALQELEIDRLRHLKKTLIEKTMAHAAH